MDRAAGVRVLERRGDVARDRGRLGRRERARREPFAQRRPGEQLHVDERALGVAHERVHGRDVRVLELRGRNGLALEALQVLGLGGQFGRDELERDRTAVEIEVHRLVDLAHAAAAEPADDLVVGDARADHLGRGP